MSQETHGPVIRQATIRLPYFEEDLPGLWTSDGVCYVPMIAVCALLGLNPKVYRRRWRGMLLGQDARKLPYQSSAGYRRVVWCLSFPMTLLACCQVYERQVYPEKRDQLDRLTQEVSDVLAQQHQGMVEVYHRMRRVLFAFLTQVDGEEERMHARVQEVVTSLTEEDRPLLKQLETRGYALLTEAVRCAKVVLAWQADTPIVDLIALGPDGMGQLEESMPLLPVMREEDCVSFFDAYDAYDAWSKEWHTFFTVRGS